MTLRRLAAAVTLLGAVAAGCGGSGSTPTTSSAARTPPDLGALLRQPVATPSVCTSENASTYKQRRSPWVGHVDISVFLRSRANPTAVKSIGRELRHASTVERLYFESNREAYAEFQRLYTCWAAVPRSQAPASYRVVLKPSTTIGQRDALVTRIVHDPGVGSVSCDPALPCTDVVASAAGQRR